MSDVEWDADDFEPQGFEKPATGTDKWEGEDEEDDVKDNWDDEDQDGEKKEDDDSDQKATQVKKKKSMKERIAEKEAKRKAELEEKRKQAEEEAKRQEEMTPADIMAEKLRQQRLQEEADFQIAMSTLGVTNDELSGKSLDKINPKTKEDFEEFAKMLTEKIAFYEKSTHYVAFLETLYRDLATGLEADDIKKLGTTLNTLGNEKVKQSKGKAKKKSKKASMNVGKSSNIDDYDDFGGDVYDDFI